MDQSDEMISVYSRIPPFYCILIKPLNLPPPFPPPSLNINSFYLLAKDLIK